MKKTKTPAPVTKMAPVVINKGAKKGAAKDMAGKTKMGKKGC